LLLPIRAAAVLVGHRVCWVAGTASALTCGAVLGEGRVLAESSRRGAVGLTTLCVISGLASRRMTFASVAHASCARATADG